MKPNSLLRAFVPHPVEVFSMKIGRHFFTFGLITLCSAFACDCGDDGDVPCGFDQLVNTFGPVLQAPNAKPNSMW